jgi:hypothetical protein
MTCRQLTKFVKRLNETGVSNDNIPTVSGLGGPERTLGHLKLADNPFLTGLGVVVGKPRKHVKIEYESHIVPNNNVPSGKGEKDGQLKRQIRSTWDSTALTNAAGNVQTSVSKYENQQTSVNMFSKKPDNSSKAKESLNFKKGQIPTPAVNPSEFLSEVRKSGSSSTYHHLIHE